MKRAAEIFVGIDESKAGLDVAAHERAEAFRASNNDAEIDQRVYALYGLTEDEIRIVEGK